jgi:hypothetical protein
MESSTVLATILRQAENEKQGASKMTLNELDTGVLIWLARKGFTEHDDIRQLERLAGSLSRGLLMLLHALPKRPTTYQAVSNHSSLTTEPSKRRRERDREAHFDPDQFQVVKVHVRGVRERLEGRRLSPDRSGNSLILVASHPVVGSQSCA